jgi:hypothetical protein
VLICDAMLKMNSLGLQSSLNTGHRFAALTIFETAAQIWSLQCGNYNLKIEGQPQVRSRTDLLWRVSDVS